MFINNLTTLIIFNYLFYYTVFTLFILCSVRPSYSVYLNWKYILAGSLFLFFAKNTHQNFEESLYIHTFMASCFGLLLAEAYNRLITWPLCVYFIYIRRGLLFIICWKGLWRYPILDNYTAPRLFICSFCML